MPLIDTIANTSFGAALTATGATAALTIGDSSGAINEDNTVVIVATAITTGATLQLERRGSTGDSWVPFASFTLTANGSYAVPAWGGMTAKNAEHPNALVRVNCTARTDGSYACSLSKLTKH